MPPRCDIFQSTRLQTRLRKANLFTPYRYPRLMQAKPKRKAAAVPRLMQAKPKRKSAVIKKRPSAAPRLPVQTRQATARLAQRPHRQPYR